MPVSKKGGVMSATRKAALAVLCVLALSGESAVGANGSKGKIVSLTAEHQLESGVYELSSDIEPILFPLVTLQDKYRVLRIRMRNRSKRTLALSKAGDAVSVETPRGPVRGILDLPAHDRAVWDKLDRKFRENLIYPEHVEAGEEDNVFVFLPATEITTVPMQLRYKFGSLGGREIVLADRRKAAAN
jgi:hypothetical protein